MIENLLYKYEAPIKVDYDVLYSLFPAVNARRGKANKIANLKGFVYTFNKYAGYFGIDTKLEVRHFLAQIAHESDQWNAYEEYASGKAYEGRKDLGNTKPGYGVRHKGRGGIQTTGYVNYVRTGREMAKLPFLTKQERALFENDGLLKNPKLLQDPVWGTLSSLIYWNYKGLNELCMPDDKVVTIRRLSRKIGWYNYSCSPLEAISRKVNGGMNGYNERKNYYKALGKYY